MSFPGYLTSLAHRYELLRTHIQILTMPVYVIQEALPNGDMVVLWGDQQLPMETFSRGI
jgi:hypothetical protein